VRPLRRRKTQKMLLRPSLGSRAHAENEGEEVQRGPQHAGRVGGRVGGGHQKTAEESDRGAEHGSSHANHQGSH
jgi:hypothetical protein